MSFKIEVAPVPPEWRELDEKMYPGMEVLLQFQTPDYLTKLTRRCTEQIRGARGDEPTTQLDYARFGRTLAEKAILGWRGFKLEYLEKMLSVTEETRKNVIANNGEVPYSTEAAQALAVHADDPSFLRPVSRLVTSWANWQDREREGAKNESAV